MKKRKAYIFTNKKTSNSAVMAVILGVIGLLSLGAAIFLTYQNQDAALRCGVVSMLAMLYSAVGLVLGVRAALKPDYYKLFPVLAILLNGAALGVAALILYMGANS